MRGRKPKPTNLRVVAGNPGKRALPKNEPKPRLKIPTPPAHLSREGNREWRRVSKELFALGLLSEIDRAVLGAYCAAYARWVDAEQALAEAKKASPQSRGLVVETVRGDRVTNSLVTISNKAAVDMVRFAAEFGMSPAARARVAAGIVKEEDEAERFFG